jgi:hypothetical protein
MNEINRPLDIFLIAKGNATALDMAFEKLCQEVSPQNAELIREFASWVHAIVLISINVNLIVVGELLNGRPHLNTHELASESASISGLHTEDLLRKQLPTYYEKRIIFDRAFARGESFRYAALYATGAGLTDYAPYCLVLSDTFQQSLTDIACLSGDSLNICFRPDGSFDTHSVTRCTAPFSHRHVFAAVERASEIPSVEKSKWPKLIAGGGRYFEVVFIGTVSIGAVKFVSVLKTEYDRIKSLLFDSFGRKLDEAERALVHDIRVLFRGVSEGTIRIEVVT